MLSDQPYRYLTVDEMKSLGDDSLPIDVTRDERIDSNRMAQSAEYAGGVLGQQQPIAEEIISPHKVQVHGAGKTTVDGVFMGNGLHEEQPHIGRKLSWKSFLVSFLVDARGGAMRGCRHSGVRMIVPSRSTCQPTRVTCRYVKPQRTMHPPQLMEGEALASRVLELGPVSTKFIGPVVMEVPHFASLRGKEREIVILRSDNGETWREHTIENSEEIIHDVMQQCFEPEEIAQLEEQGGNHVCRFVTYDFPQYFAVVSRIRQEVHAIGPEGGMVSSTVVPQVQAVFPQGALTKKIKVGLQAQPVDPDLTAKLLGRGVAVSPIVTVEPRRRKFHKAITLSMPAPKAHSQGMINQYSGNTPTLRLLCSITGGPSRAQWEDVTGSTPLTFVNDCVSFTTTVSARFWLMDCRNIGEATRMATELYKEVIHVPFMAKFVVFAKKIEPYEARLRVFCMTDDREDKTLEKQELYTEVAKSRDVEVLEGKPQFIEMAGNLVPVTKSGDQLQLQFKAFRENRLPFTVRVKDQHADIVGRTLFMKEPKVAKGEPPQHPICILNIVLPETVIPDSTTVFSDKISATYRSSLFSLSKHQNDHYIGDIRIVDLSNLLGKDWVQLATEIGITTEEIDEIISHNTDSIARQAQSMIRLYKDKPNYDIHALENALKNIGREDIMKKCKSGRLSHSRDFDDTDIMKNSESVEELVRQESKRIQHELDEVKYSAEEKEVEESESDEEITKRTVAERREKIVKRLSIERQIPASTQKKEITREITEIKRKSLIEDKKAIHESEIMMQLPTDNIIKSAIVPDQVIKMKMGKMDSTDISKSDFDKELTHKFKTSGRSSEEDDSLIEQKRPESVDNLKIVADIISAEKPSKLQSPIEDMATQISDTMQDTKKLTEDFLNVEKQTQLPSDITITEKFVEEVKEKFEQKPTKSIPTPTEKISADAAEKETKKVESIVSAFEITKDANNIEKKKSEHISTVKTIHTDNVVTETILISETVKPSETQKKQEKVEVVEKQESKKIGDKIADFEAKSKIPKLIRRPSDETKITTVGPAAAPRKMVTTEKSLEEKKDGKKDAPEKTEINARKLTEDFITMEQKSQIPAPRKIKTDIQKVNETIKQITETTVGVPVVQQRKSLLEETEQKQPVEKPKVQEQQKKEEIIKSVTEDEKVLITTRTEEPVKVETLDKSVDKKISSIDVQLEKARVIDAKKLTHDFLSMEQQTQLPVTVTKIPVLKDEFKGLAGKVKTGVTEEISIPEDEHIAPFAEKPLEDLIKITSEIMTTVPSFPLDESICFTQGTFKDQTEMWSEERKKVEETTKDTIKDTFKSVKHEVVEKPVEDLAKITSNITSTIPVTETQKTVFETVDTVKKTVEKESVDFMKTFKTDAYSKVEELSDVVKDAKENIIQTKETVDITTKKEISKISEPFEEIKDTFKTVTETVRESYDTKKEAVKEEASKVFAPLATTVTTPKIETKQFIDDFKPTEETKEATSKLVESVKKLEDAISIVGKSLDGIETAAPIIDEGKVAAMTTRKLTEDFLNMEQKTQLPAEMIQTRQQIENIQFEKMSTLPLKEDKEIKIKETIGVTVPEKVLDIEIIPKESTKVTVPEKVLDIEMAAKESIKVTVPDKVLDKEIIPKESIKVTVPEKVIDSVKDTVKIVSTVDTTKDALKLTSEFLTMEQRTQLPSEQKWSIEIETTTLISDELAPPMPIEPRKSLTDAEFCKSVQETITKKMSEGLIEISDELKMKEADIPHSQTPPPTPIDIKSEKHEEEQVLHTTSDIKG
ncbi:ankyrin-2-like [Teleopsis dalmanni]|uniref:ankyrin-2-like n=1 Tax=Teleopsis dalmanni TaxID=139649 RepID=UPI0018CF2418|nr:ankyrin-2-like [Teleopsis dalmanni]